MSFPPLVPPGPELTAPQRARYSRQLLLPDLGGLGQRRLRAARVLMVGAGGLGSPALLYLAAAGVGTLGVLDADAVDESNLQRQVLHGRSDVGRSKVESAAAAIAELNPEVRVIRHPVRLERANALDLLAGYHLVLDGTDSFPSRYLISDACAILGLPCVWGSVYRFDGQVSLFWSRPPTGAGRAVTYRDLFPQPPPPELVPSCAEGGVLGMVCGSVGTAMATEAVKLICGIGEPLLGRVLVYDGLAGNWRTLRVSADPEAPAVTTLADDYQAFCGVAPEAAAGSAPSNGQPQAASDGQPPASDGQPPATIGPAELADWMRRRERGDLDFLLVDVREPAEHEVVAIPGAVSLPVADFRSGSALPELIRLSAGRPVVCYCKTGSRSAQAVRLARAAGITGVVQLTGGVLAWIDLVDPSLPRY